MGARRQAREAALQALFMCDALNEWNEQAAKFCLDHFSISATISDYTIELCSGVIENIAMLDSKVSCASEHWSLSRMSRVDRCLLRLAIFEMKFIDDVPLNVAIDEAIEIAKRYGADSSPVFINGVLDRIGADLRKELKLIKGNKAKKAVLASDADELLDDELPLADGTSG